MMTASPARGVLLRAADACTINATPRLEHGGQPLVEESGNATLFQNGAHLRWQE